MRRLADLIGWIAMILAACRIGAYLSDLSLGASIALFLAGLFVVGAAERIR